MASSQDFGEGRIADLFIAKLPAGGLAAMAAFITTAPGGTALIGGYTVSAAVYSAVAWGCATIAGLTAKDFWDVLFELPNAWDADVEATAAQRQQVAGQLFNAFATDYVKDHPYMDKTRLLKELWRSYEATDDHLWSTTHFKRKYAQANPTKKRSKSREKLKLPKLQNQHSKATIKVPRLK